MIHYIEGTVFNTPAKTIVNTVNCKGVMGAGLALEFKLRYPLMYEDYVTKCNENKLRIGRPSLFQINDNLWVLNFPTKNHWKDPSKLQYIEEGLAYFRENYNRVDMKAAAFPKLGTSNGGLDWKDVQILMEKYLGDIDIDIYICLDKKENPEGIEEKMVTLFNSISIGALKKYIKLSTKQMEMLERAQPIKRFYNLNNISGIGDTTYEKLFKYFYECSMDEKNVENNIAVQLSLFS